MKKPKNQEHDADNPEPEDVIDVAEGMEQVPSRMLNKLAGWKPHLRSIFFLYHPAGSSRTTFHTYKRVLHFQPPIAEDTIEIVSSAMAVVRDALNSWPISSEKPSRWRLKVRLNIEGTEAYRHIDFEAGPDDGFWDSDDGEEPTRQYKLATDMLEQSLELAIKATNNLVKAGEHFAKMGEAVTHVATGAAALANSAGAGLAQVMEVQARMESERMRAEAEIEQTRAWAQTLEKFGPMIMEAVMAMNKRPPSQEAQKPKESVHGPRNQNAKDLSALARSAGPYWEDFLAWLVPEDRAIIDAMLREGAPDGSDEKFDDYLGKLVESWAPKWNRIGKKIQEKLGPHAEAFERLFFSCMQKR